MNFIKNLLIGLSLVGTIGLLLFLRAPKTYLADNLFKTTQLENQSVIQQVSASGTLFPREQISIGSLVTGRIEKWHVDDNDLVTKGQLLITLYDGVGDANVKKFTGALEQKKALACYQEAFFKRQEALFKLGQISRNEYEGFKRDHDVAIANVKSAEGDLSAAQQIYDNLFIKAPSDGTVIARKVDVGQMIASAFNATELYTIAKNLKFLEARLDIDEASIGMIKDNQDAEFVVDAYPTESFKTKVKIVKYLSKIVGTVVTFQTILNIENNELRLRPGMTTDVDITIGKADNVPTLSNKAFRINANGLKEIAQKLGYEYHKLDLIPSKRKVDSVWVVKGASFIQTIVKLGLNDGRYSQVLEGIDKESKVIIDTTEAAQENTFVKGIFGKSAIGK